MCRTHKVGPSCPVPKTRAPFTSNVHFSRTVCRVLHSSRNSVTVITRASMVSSCLCLLSSGRRTERCFHLPYNSCCRLDTSSGSRITLSSSACLLPRPSLRSRLYQVLHSSISLPRRMRTRDSTIARLTYRFYSLLRSRNCFFGGGLVHSKTLLRSVTELRGRRAGANNSLFLRLNCARVDRVVSRRRNLRGALLGRTTVIFLSSGLVRRARHMAVRGQFTSDLYGYGDPRTLGSRRQRLGRTLSLRGVVRAVYRVAV